MRQRAVLSNLDANRNPSISSLKESGIATPVPTITIEDKTTRTVADVMGSVTPNQNLGEAFPGQGGLTQDPDWVTSDPWCEQVVNKRPSTLMRDPSRVET